jgi:hypothetical protein
MILSQPNSDYETKAWCSRTACERAVRTSLLAQVGVIAMIVWLVLASDYRRSRTAQPRIVRPTVVRCLDRVLTASPHVRGTQEASSTLGLEPYGARNEMPLVYN